MLLLDKPANKLLICVTVPVSVTELVPDPPMTTPVVPADTVNVPSPTVSVASTLLENASTSAIEMPVPCKLKLTCSVALYQLCVNETVGASSMEVTVTVAVAVLDENALVPPLVVVLTVVPATPVV